jgi:hypothetical protein
LLGALIYLFKRGTGREITKTCLYWFQQEP